MQARAFEGVGVSEADAENVYKLVKSKEFPTGQSSPPKTLRSGLYELIAAALDPPVVPFGNKAGCLAVLRASHRRQALLDLTLNFLLRLLCEVVPAVPIDSDVHALQFGGTG